MSLYFSILFALGFKLACMTKTRDLTTPMQINLMLVNVTALSCSNYKYTIEWMYH